MFLLLAAGFVIAAGALISEWMGGCSRRCKFMRSCSVKSNQTRDELNHDDHSLDYETTRIKKTSNASAKSRETLEGQVINVSEDSITIHSEYNVFKWDSKRSSADVDKEIREIFKKDHEQKRLMLDDKKASFEYEAVKTNTVCVFGDSI